MRLVDLNPGWISDKWLGLEGRHGIGLFFQCPSHPDRNGDIVWVMFDTPLDGGTPFPKGSIVSVYWHREGDTFDTLTLSPSIDGSKYGCWHGWIRNGEVTNA